METSGGGADGPLCVRSQDVSEARHATHTRLTTNRLQAAGAGRGKLHIGWIPKYKSDEHTHAAVFSPRQPCRFFGTGPVIAVLSAIDGAAQSDRRRPCRETSARPVAGRVLILRGTTLRREPGRHRTVPVPGQPKLGCCCTSAVTRRWNAGCRYCGSVTRNVVANSYAHQRQGQSTELQPCGGSRRIALREGVNCLHSGI